MPRVHSVARIPLHACSQSDSLKAATQNARFVTFDGLVDSNHFAVRFGTPATVPLVRLHSECVTGDVFGSLRCDCGTQLQNARRHLERVGGWLLYLRQEGRGIGLAAKLQAYVLQEQGLDTYAANRALGFADDARDYADAVRMLRALGVAEIDLLSGNPEKATALQRLGIRVRQMLPCPGTESKENAAYLAAKLARCAREACAADTA
jgi:GTP cyclohydrolase II